MVYDLLDESLLEIINQKDLSFLEVEELYMCSHLNKVQEELQHKNNLTDRRKLRWNATLQNSNTVAMSTQKRVIDGINDSLFEVALMAIYRVCLMTSR